MADTLEDVGVILRRATARSKQARGVPTVAVTPAPGSGAGAGVTRLARSRKPVVLVMGSGWAAHAFIKVVDTDAFDVLVLSPRTFFFFTPMLPSSAVGTVEFRSLLEPIRVSNPAVTYLEAECVRLQPAARLASCVSFAALPLGGRPEFEVAYDVAVLAVGEASSTFGVPGVAEHCHFLKEIPDAQRIRTRVQELFELAALPGASVHDMQGLLSFVVVGGGPTGVEFAGTLCDFLRGDLRAKYPGLMPHVSVTLLQGANIILPQFSAALQAAALATLSREGVDVRTGLQVTAVRPGVVVAKDSAGTETDIRFGLAVWSAGNAARPLVRQLSADLPAQRPFAPDPSAPVLKLAVDPWMRVEGAPSMLAVGDASRLWGAPLPATAQVAGQQGAYAARLLNRGFGWDGLGGLHQPPPLRPASALARAAGGGQQEAAKPFSFFGLGADGRTLTDAPRVPLPSRRAEGGGLAPRGRHPGIRRRQQQPRQHARHRALRPLRLPALAQRLPDQAGVCPQPFPHSHRLAEDTGFWPRHQPGELPAHAPSCLLMPAPASAHEL